MPRHILVRQGDGRFHISRLADPRLPDVQNFDGSHKGAVDPVRIAQYIGAAKPFLAQTARTDGELTGLVVSPTGIDAYCLKSIFSSKVKVGTVDLSLVPRLAKAAAPALRLLGASADVRDHGGQYSFASKLGLLLVPKGPMTHNLLKVLEVTSPAKLTVPTSKLLWPVIGATTRIIDDEPLQVSIDVHEGVASLEFFYLSSKGGRSVSAKSTVGGLTSPDPALDGTRLTAHVDGRQLWSALLQAAHDGEVTLEWVKPKVLRLSYTIEQVPVHVMLAGKMPDKNGGLNKARRR